MAEVRLQGQLVYIYINNHFLFNKYTEIFHKKRQFTEFFLPSIPNIPVK